MAVPGGPAAQIDWRHAFSIPPVQDSILQNLRYRDAANLMVAIAVHPPFQRYNQCILNCESWHGNFLHPGPHANWTAIAPGNDFRNAAPVICPRRPTFQNAAIGGTWQPSFCVEDCDTPVIGCHTGPPQPGLVQVCSQCKAFRATEFQWKKERISLGICGPCRNWAIRNLAVGESECICEPVGNYENGDNNNEPRYRHLCRDHELTFWNAIQANANQEIIWRQSAIKGGRRKKRGHGWTHKKGQPAGVLTPSQRRARCNLGGQVLTAAPTCVCGNVIGNAGHDRTAASLAMRVRNCLGCLGFIRHQ